MPEIPRPSIMFIGANADSQLKAGLQLMFTKLNAKAIYADPYQAIGRLMQKKLADLIIWRCTARTRQNQKILVQLSEINKHHHPNILVLCPGDLFAEIYGFGLENILPIPFKGIAFYQKVQEMLKTTTKFIPSEFTNLLASQPFFSNLSNETLVMLLHYGSFEKYPSVYIILEEGVTYNELYVLLEGEAEVIAPSIPKVVYKLKPGASFSESSFSRPSRARNTRVVATQNCTVFRIPLSGLDQLEDHMQLEIYKELTVSMSNKIRLFLEM